MKYSHTIFISLILARPSDISVTDAFKDLHYGAWGTKLYLVRFVKRGTWTLALQSPPTKSILKPSDEADLNDQVWKQLPLPVEASVLVGFANLAEYAFLSHCPPRVQGYPTQRIILIKCSSYYLFPKLQTHISNSLGTSIPKYPIGTCNSIGLLSWSFSLS